MTTERAVLAGGCFWGMQDLIRKLPGVVSTRVGYTGGDVPNATYRHHGTHAEAIEIIFDPARTTYRRLLEFFFEIHDPTTFNRQGNDRGTSYRSAIFFTNDEQKAVALDTIADVEASGLWPGKVVTEVAPAGEFLGSGARAPGLPRTDPARLYLPFREAGLGAASPYASKGLNPVLRRATVMASVCRCLFFPLRTIGSDAKESYGRSGHPGLGRDVLGVQYVRTFAVNTWSSHLPAIFRYLGAYPSLWKPRV